MIFFPILLLILICLLPAKGNMICKQREQSQLLKFIASLLVVIGHQASFYNIHDEIFMRETALGALCVSFFLFMSEEADGEVDRTCFNSDVIICCSRMGCM